MYVLEVNGSSQGPWRESSGLLHLQQRSQAPLATHTILAGLTCARCIWTPLRHRSPREVYPVQGPFRSKTQPTAFAKPSQGK